MQALNRPNILFIHTDQQRADTLGCYHNQVIRTPHLDQLADSGVLFENAHCTHPLCMPSRASLLTGRYIHSHKLYRNGIALDDQEVTVAEVLRDHGYQTGLMGKAHFTPYKGNPDIHVESMQVNNGVSHDDCWNYWRTFDQEYYGFDDVQMSMGHGSYGMNGGQYGLWVHEEHPDKVKLFSQQEALGETDTRYNSWKSSVPLEIHSSTWITDRTIEFIKKNKQKPFFAWVGYQEPHEPFNPPAPYCDMYDPKDMPLPVGKGNQWGDNPPEHIGYYLNRRNWPNISEQKTREVIAHYYGMVSLVDDCVGRIMEALEKEGLSENTIVVFTSDHGDWLGDHQLWLKGGVHTRGLTRIPLIVKWPKTGKPGHRVTGVASLVDLVPTLLDAAGAAIPYGVQGTSLRPVIQGKIQQVRPYALIEHRHEPYHVNIQFQNEKAVLNKGEKDFYIKTIVTNQHRISYIPGTEYGELFDICNDPNELHNLWNRNIKLRNELLRQLLDVMIETEDPLPQRKWSV